MTIETISTIYTTKRLNNQTYGTRGHQIGVRLGIMRSEKGFVVIKEKGKIDNVWREKLYCSAVLLSLL